MCHILLFIWRIKPLKTYCLDTSVFIDNPNVIELLGESEIIVPFCVLNELDNNRKKSGSVGKRAREAIRNIDKLFRKENFIFTSNAGGVIRFISSDFDRPTNDLKIIACAEWIKTQENKLLTVLSNDIGLRIHAETKGIHAEEFRYQSDDFAYTGIQYINIDQKYVDLLHSSNHLEISLNDITMSDTNIYQNQMLIISGNEKKSSTLARVEIKHNKILLHKIKRINPWNISPVNAEQTFAIDLLMNPDIELVSLVGKAGCGKTLLAIAAGLEQVLEERIYDQVIILKPVVSVGDGIGFLPGTLEEKLDPWMQPIKDNLHVLFNGDRKTIQMLFDSGEIIAEAISFIRGRSIPKSFIIVDESQNLTSDQLKTILTRASHGSKIVLTGDVEQIDNKNIDSYSNGLSQIVETFKNERIAGHITLRKGQRSALATIASEIL